MFHVNPKTGEAGQCSAKQGNCPFGDLDEHFTTKEGAVKYFEGQQNGSFASISSPQKKFPYFIEVDLNENLIAKDGKFKDGTYSKLHFVKKAPGVYAAYGARRYLISYAESRGLAGPLLKHALIENPEYVREEALEKAPRAHSATQQKLAKKSSPKNEKEFEAAVMNIPSVSDSKVIKPPKLNDHEGYLNGRRYVGALVGTPGSGPNGYLGNKEASAKIRELVKQAKEAGELPQWLAISATPDSGAWVSSITVKIGYRKDGSRKAESIPRSWLYYPNPDSSAVQKKKPAAERIYEYVETLGRSFESSDNNGMVDYHQNSNNGWVRFLESGE